MAASTLCLRVVFPHVCLSHVLHLYNVYMMCVQMHPCLHTCTCEGQTTTSVVVPPAQSSLDFFSIYFVCELMYLGKCMHSGGQRVTLRVILPGAWVCDTIVSLILLDT